MTIHFAVYLADLLERADADQVLDLFKQQMQDSAADDQARASIGLIKTGNLEEFLLVNDEASSSTEKATASRATSSLQLALGDHPNERNDAPVSHSEALSPCLSPAIGSPTGSNTVSFAAGHHIVAEARASQAGSPKEGLSPDVIDAQPLEEPQHTSQGADFLEGSTRKTAQHAEATDDARGGNKHVNQKSSATKKRSKSGKEPLPSSKVDASYLWLTPECSRDQPIGVKQSARGGEGGLGVFNAGSTSIEANKIVAIYAGKETTESKEKAEEQSIDYMLAVMEQQDIRLDGIRDLNHLKEISMQVKSTYGHNVFGSLINHDLRGQNVTKFLLQRDEIFQRNLYERYRTHPVLCDKQIGTRFGLVVFISTKVIKPGHELLFHYGQRSSAAFSERKDAGFQVGDYEPKVLEPDLTDFE